MSPGQETKPVGKLEGLQVLRAVAALLVVWCHVKYNLGIPPAEAAKIPGLGSEAGAVGVDIFFVISGFVIALTAEHFGRDWKSFLALRLARVVPLAYLLSTYLLLIILAGKVSQVGTGSPAHVLSFQKFFNTYAFVPLFDRNGYTVPLCVNGWTLSFEMWFYLCFAALIFFCGGTKARLRLPMFFAVGVTATLLFYHSAWYLPKFLFNPMVLEFSAGCLLYHFRNHIGPRLLLLMGAVSLAAIYFVARTEFLGLLSTTLGSPMQTLQRPAVWGPAATCLVGLSTQLDLKYSLRWPKFLLLLGDASYSIYLVSPLIMWTVMGAALRFNKLIGSDLIKLSPLSCGIIYIVGTIIASILLWKYFEVPVTRLTRKFLLRLVAKQSIPAAAPVPAKAQ